MSSFQMLHEQADRCRRLAAAALDEPARNALLALAQSYERRAETLDKGEGANRLAGCDQALSVTPVEGEVALSGPGRIAGSLTPEAAEASAERLLEASQKARKQVPRP